MSEVMKQPAVLGSPEIGLKGAGLSSYLPAAAAVLGAGALTMLRIKVGPEHFSKDGALMMLALAAYLIAATFYLMNLYAPSRLFERIGLGSATIGVLMNLQSWLTRWVAYREHDASICLQPRKPAAEWPVPCGSFPLAVIGTVSKGSVFMLGTVFWGFDASAFGSYGSAVFLPPHSPLPLRAEIPYVGWLLFAASVLLAGVVALFCRYVFRGDEGARRLGHHVLKAALLAQLLAVGVLVWQVKTLKQGAVCTDARPGETACVNTRGYYSFWKEMALREGGSPEQVALVPREDAEKRAAGFVSQHPGDLL